MHHWKNMFHRRANRCRTTHSNVELSRELIIKRYNLHNNGRDSHTRTHMHMLGERMKRWRKMFKYYFRVLHRLEFSCQSIDYDVVIPNKVIPEWTIWSVLNHIFFWLWKIVHIHISSKRKRENTASAHHFLRALWTIDFSFHWHSQNYCFTKIFRLCDLNQFWILTSMRWQTRIPK